MFKFLFRLVLVFGLALFSFYVYARYYVKLDSTAKAVAWERHRISAWERKDNSKVGNDNLAKHFINQDMIVKTFLDLLHILPLSYEFENCMAARTAFFDELILNNTKDYQQFVILGSGYDSRAKRFENELKDITVFEVDQESIQKEKIRISNGLNWPKNVKFVQTNFFKDSLRDNLLNSGYNPKLNTIFLMEGVSMYLNEESIKKNLEFIREYSNNAIIGFDYFEKNESDAISSYLKHILVRFFGEKFTFQFDNVSQFLEKENFKITQQLLDKDMPEYLSKIYHKNLTTSETYHFLIVKKIK